MKSDAGRDDIGFVRPSQPCRQASLDRRSFLALGSAALLGSLAGCSDPTAPDPSPAVGPNLTSTPGVPTRTATPGETPLDLGDPRDGLLYVPASYRPDAPIPLLVALHGSGGSAQHWRGFYDACESRGMALLAVDARDTTWDRIRGAFAADVTFIDLALAHTFDRLVVDPARIALGGFSDGASYTLSLGPSNGTLFRQLIAFSPGFARPAEGRVGRPRIFVSHGTRDTILPVGASRDTIVPTFEYEGYEVTYVEFDGGHEVPRDVGGAALDWFLA